MYVELLEGRTHLSAGSSSLKRPSVQMVGPSTGLTPQVVTPTFDHLEITSTPTPSSKQSNADLDTSIHITVTHGGSGIDATNMHLIRAAVQITDLTTNTTYRSSDPGSELRKLKTSGGGDVLIIQLKLPFAKKHLIKVEINGNYTLSSNFVRDVNGVRFAPFVARFKTGTYLAEPTINASFKQIGQAVANRPYVATTIGPDHRLYAATSDGFIYRYTIAADGSLTNEFAITTIRDHNTINNPGGARIITGIAFSPLCKPDALVMYVSHGQHRFGSDQTGGQGDVGLAATNFTGKISTISGPNLTGYQDLIVNIPRSTKDHMNNQIVFAPNGKALYFGLAGMNAMGAPDLTWGNKAENIYTATILQLRLGGGETGINRYIHAHGAVNLLLDGPGETHSYYNIFNGRNPLRIYADGVRNAFDMVFASNNHLYAAVNGSSAGGNVPATPSDLSTVPVAFRPDKDRFKDANGNYLYNGPASPALNNVNQVEEDVLLDVKNGAYYGHPNPARGEYIFGAGNTGNAANDPYQIVAYGSGQQQPDRSYTRPAYDFKQDYSPDGILQYKAIPGSAAASLDGYLLVCRYSSGGDILALRYDKNGAIDLTQQRIPGFTGLNSPLDIVEDNQTGNLYVTVLTGEIDSGGIMLLKPRAPAAIRRASAVSAAAGLAVAEKQSAELSAGSYFRSPPPGSSTGKSAGIGSGLHKKDDELPLWQLM